MSTVIAKMIDLLSMAVILCTVTFVCNQFAVFIAFTVKSKTQKRYMYLFQTSSVWV